MRRASKRKACVVCDWSHNLYSYVYLNIGWLSTQHVFFLSLLSFSVFPFLLPFSFFVRFDFSSCRFRFFLVSPSSLLFSLLCFFLRLGGGFCCSVISSWRYTPPALLASRKYAYSPCVLSSFLRSRCWLIYFSSLPSLFRFRFGHRLFPPVFFLVGTTRKLSTRFRFLLRLV